MKEDDKFSHAGDVLKILFERLLPEEKAEYSHFFSGWENIVGADTAMHVFPRDIINNVLVLETDHPLWSQQIRMRQEGLLKIIRGKYPSLEIKRFRVVIGKKDNKAAIIKNNSLPDKEISVPKREVNEKEAEPFFELLETMRRRGDS